MNSEKIWTVVKFNDNSVEAVPSGWIIGNMCYWPPFSKEKLISAIKKSEMCSTCWPSFKIEFFKNATFDNYMSARHKARKAEETSDLNSGAEVLQGGILKKTRHRKPKLLSSSDSDSSTNESFLPLPPKIRKATTVDVTNATHNLHQQHGSENRMDAQSTMTSSTRMMEIPFQREHIEKTHEVVRRSGITSQSIFNNYEQGEKENDLYPRNLTSSKSIPEVDNKCNNSCHHCCMQSNIYGKCFKELSCQNHLLRSMVSEVLSEIKQVHEVVNIKSPIENNNQRTSIFLKYQPSIVFPLDTIEEMEQFDEFMKDEKDFAEAVEELSKHGGTNNYNFVKRVLSLLITNTLAKQCSWCGRKGKKTFNLLAMSKIIIGAADKAGLSCSFKSTESSIQKWLKRAPERLNANQNKKL